MKKTIKKILKNGNVKKVLILTETDELIDITRKYLEKIKKPKEMTRSNLFYKKTTFTIMKDEKGVSRGRQVNKIIHIRETEKIKFKEEFICLDVIAKDPIESFNIFEEIEKEKQASFFFKIKNFFN